MGIISTRIQAVSAYLSERLRHGLPIRQGQLDQEILVIVDGVGGFQFAPVLIRRMLRQTNATMGTVYFPWQFGLVGEIFTDLMWLRRNRMMGAKLAEQLLQLRQEFPETKIHVIAYSGGVGISVFALEYLSVPTIVESLIMACPALSPSYNLAPALRNVNRAYALISAADYGILGAGTTVLGTTDRKHCAAAGLRGFQIPDHASTDDLAEYAKLKEIRWDKSQRALGHSGGHTGWASGKWLARHLRPIVEGGPLLPGYDVCGLRESHHRANDDR